MHGIPMSDSLFRTIAVLLLNLAQASGAMAPLPSTTWLGTQGEQFKRIVEEVARNEALRGLVLPRTIDRRAIDSLIQAADQAIAAEKQRERETLMSSSLDAP